MVTPPRIAPMLATAGPLPGPDEDDLWGFENKFDGARIAITARGDGTVRLTSRRGNDVTATYPELAGLGEELGSRAAVLDGEVVALDENGLANFGLLQRRMGVTDARRAQALARGTPVTLMFFDVMWLDGRSLSGSPYAERRVVLSDLGLQGRRWSVPAYVAGHGARAWEAVVAAGGEGLVAKRLDSPYVPGARSPWWRKTKRVETLDVVVGGWAPGRGSLAGLPGAVLVGRDESEGLRATWVRSAPGCPTVSVANSPPTWRSSPPGVPRSRGRWTFPTRSGSTRAWSRRSRSPRGPPRGAFGTRCGSACART